MNVVDASEQNRIAALQSLQILDTPPSENFDRLTSIICRVLDSPIALVCLVDRERQWFKSNTGLGDVFETHRNIAFCHHTILPNAPDVMVVHDAKKDPRFKDTALVTGSPYIRFYAGAPIKMEIHGQVFKLGTVCVLDTKPRESFGVKDKQLLIDMASIASDEFELIRADAAIVGERINEEQQRYITCTAHDLRTPLTVFKLTITMFKDFFKERKAQRDAALTKEDAAAAAAAAGGSAAPPSSSHVRKSRRKREHELTDVLEQAEVAVEMMEETVCNAIDSARARWVKREETVPNLAHGEHGGWAGEWERFSTVDVKELLQSFKQLHNRHHGEDVTVSVEVDETEVPPQVLCDGPVLKRVLVNLITNAFKHATRPPPTAPLPAAPLSAAPASAAPASAAPASAAPASEAAAATPAAAPAVTRKSASSSAAATTTGDKGAASETSSASCAQEEDVAAAAGPGTLGPLFHGSGGACVVNGAVVSGVQGGWGVGGRISEGSQDEANDLGSVSSSSSNNDPTEPPPPVPENTTPVQGRSLNLSKSMPPPLSVPVPFNRRPSATVSFAQKFNPFGNSGSTGSSPPMSPLTPQPTALEEEAASGGGGGDGSDGGSNADTLASLKRKEEYATRSAVGSGSVRDSPNDFSPHSSLDDSNPNDLAASVAASERKRFGKKSFYELLARPLTVVTAATAASPQPLTQPLTTTTAKAAAKGKSAKAATGGDRGNRSAQAHRGRILIRACVVSGAADPVQSFLSQVGALPAPGRETIAASPEDFGGAASSPAASSPAQTFAPCKWLRVEVHDNGPGVPPGMQRQLFAEAFVSEALISSGGGALGALGAQGLSSSASSASAHPFAPFGTAASPPVPGGQGVKSFSSRQGSGLGLFVVNVCAQDLRGSCGFNCANGSRGQGTERDGSARNNATPPSEPLLGGSVFWFDVPLVTEEEHLISVERGMDASVEADNLKANAAVQGGSELLEQSNGSSRTHRRTRDSHSSRGSRDSVHSHSRSQAQGNSLERPPALAAASSASSPSSPSCSSTMLAEGGGGGGGEVGGGGSAEKAKGEERCAPYSFMDLNALSQQSQPPQPPPLVHSASAERRASSSVAFAAAAEAESSSGGPLSPYPVLGAVRSGHTPRHSASSSRFQQSSRTSTGRTLSPWSQQSGTSPSSRTSSSQRKVDSRGSLGSLDSQGTEEDENSVIDEESQESGGGGSGKGSHGGGGGCKRPAPVPSAGRLLVVDDSVMVQKLLCAALTRLNFSVETAKNGREALEMMMAAEEPYLAVLMDFLMPVMDGITATAAFRDWEKTVLCSEADGKDLKASGGSPGGGGEQVEEAAQQAPSCSSSSAYRTNDQKSLSDMSSISVDENPPVARWKRQLVIGISANAEGADLEAAQRAGVDHFLSKPVKVSQLVEYINGPPQSSTP